MQSLRNMFSLFMISVSLFIISNVLVLAQDSNDADNDQSETDTALIEQGYEAFVANACSACHGQNAEGNDIGPALAGHTEFQVRRQVRAPIGIMLVFSLEQLPPEDLDALVAYILSLEEMAEEGDSEHDVHEMDGISIGDIVFAHHWLLWLALETGDTEASLHHTAHTIEYLEAIHLPQMQDVLAALSINDLDSARAIVEPMVGDMGTFSDDPNIVAFQMTYLAATSADQETALHFANHQLDQMETEEDIAFTENLIAHIETCEFEEATGLLNEYLDGDVNFIPQVTDIDMSDDENMDMSDEDDDHEDDENMDMSDEDDDHEDDENMDMSDEDDDHEDDENMDMSDEDDDHEDDENMDMSDEDDDHEDDENSACSDHDEDIETTTDERDD